MRLLLLSHIICKSVVLSQFLVAIQFSFSSNFIVTSLDWLWSKSKHIDIFLFIWWVIKDEEVEFGLMLLGDSACFFFFCRHFQICVKIVISEEAGSVHSTEHFILEFIHYRSVTFDCTALEMYAVGSNEFQNLCV